MNSLTIEATSLSSFVAQVDANFPFKTPLLIQALDSNNRVITDGPDSSLVLYIFTATTISIHQFYFSNFQTIQVEITPPTACLSVDSNFTLVDGQAVFPGSVCEVGGTVTLRFFTTDSQGSDHYTASTPSITVSGIFIIHYQVISTVVIVYLFATYRRVQSGRDLSNLC